MNDTGVGDEIETFCARDSGGYPGEVIQVFQVTEAQGQFCSISSGNDPGSCWSGASNSC